ncbi:MAG: N-acetylneuraminate synthase family protein [Spirochaetaceae bacterium]
MSPGEAAGQPRQSGPAGPPRVIAEIGTAHGGDMSKAAELINAAAEAGADVAKFQAVIADEIVHPAAGSIELPGGPTPIYERFRALEQKPEFYAELEDRCLEAGIGFLCTPFGLASAGMLKELRIREWKVASPELNHLPLLRYLGETGVPVILSTGVSRLADIELALETLRASGSRQITLLHCITAYPAREEEYNLALLPHLASLFGVTVGLSDHTTDPQLLPGLAVLQGAGVIEKHITLSRDSGGLDDPIALEPGEFAGTVATVRRVWQLLRAGAGVETVRLEFEDAYGTERIASIMGDGVKRLAPGERGSYGRTNRSIVALRDLEAGELIEESCVALLRSEQNVEPGLHPRELPEILGLRLFTRVVAGQGLRWEHLTTRTTGT